MSPGEGSGGLPKGFKWTRGVARFAFSNSLLCRTSRGHLLKAGAGIPFRARDED